MATDERILERGKLLKKAFSRIDLFEIGKRLRIPYFRKFESGWEINEEEASFEIASHINEDELKTIFSEHKPREWVVFRGRYYTLEEGKLSLKGSWRALWEGLQWLKAKYGKELTALLTLMMSREEISIDDVKGAFKKADPREVLEDLEEFKLVVTSYESGDYKEWSLPEELTPLIEAELGMKPKLLLEEVKTAVASPPTRSRRADYVKEEMKRIEEMNRELDEYLNDLLKHRLEKTIRFGKRFNLEVLANYLQSLFGSVLYFDSLLSITQQYGLANIEMVHSHGGTGKRTGWSLALFGEPGTGKSFSTRDMILGKPDARIPPHGIPGRNRYCGGITPVTFIRIGQAYEGKTFNFIVPEFNDFFRYKGMVEPLKLAMEQGVIKYETHRETVGPYRFTSFFSVNYNVSVYGKGYAVTVQDPNFSAIEDRMLCRLHRLTKERFIEISRSYRRLTLGEIDMEKGAQEIRDHLTLVYAIETRHPLVRDRFPYKPVMITPRVFEMLDRVRDAILEEIPMKVVRFSARLEDRAIRFAGAASLMDYFRSNLDYVPISEEALRYAIQFYVEEASVRSQEIFKPEEVLEKIL
ncbi:hypothetical protein CW711_00875 [Candidatus Bathyarchaeota archaeon]|nr:MAG: hypothetical protein B6U84_02325 [Candidatus Bathyarchaeota archaeon ex4484_40]RJS80085.1 MAG: hypothetical protein CW711_00875 [Candidatus Bathyarchaeota archaeon]